MQTAFATSAAIGGARLTTARQLCAQKSTPRVAQFGNMRMTQMKETDTKPKSSAELTREALSSRKSKVSFRKGVTEDEKQDFAYTSGVEGGIDVWLVTGVLTFLVPLIVLLVGVKTGVVDLTPR